MQKISQQLMSLFAEKLSGWNCTPSRSHWRWRIPITRGFRSRPSLQSTPVMSQVPHQRMVACHGEWICQPLKYAQPLCVIGEVLPCMTFAARTTCRQMPAPLPDDRGRRQESASSGIVTNNVKGDPGFIWRTGAGEMTIFCGLRASISANVNACCA